VTPLIHGRGTIGTAFSSRARLVSSKSLSPAAFWIVRPMISASSCPLVVSIPTGEPLRVSRALVATVVPWQKRLVRPSTSPVPRPSASAARATAPMTPSEKSWGVDGDLAVVTWPWGSTITQSVKVPPLSTATM